MKLLVTRNEYSETKNYISISPDCKEVSAVSYNWWEYIHTDQVGNIIYNNTTYSHTTSKHQVQAWSILRRLGIPIHLELNHTRNNLKYNPKEAIDAEINELEDINLELSELIKKKGTRKVKNKERQQSIIDNAYRIKDLINFRDNYLNKKVWPNTVTLVESYKEPIFDLTNEYEKRECEEYTKAKESYKKYFLKDNGVLNTNDYNKVINRMLKYDARLAPESLEKLKAIVGNVKPFMVEVMLYHHLNDLLNMLPNIGDEYFKTFQNKALKILENDHKGIINRYYLDKLHQILVNRINKKTYSPKEPVALPIPNKLKTITNKHLTLITTDRELRAEGKRQNHCIGTYVKNCLGGNVALNYKGYTFLLSSDLRVLQTNGKCNISTPIDIQNELEKLVA